MRRAKLTSPICVNQVKYLKQVLYNRLPVSPMYNFFHNVQVMRMKSAVVAKRF